MNIDIRFILLVKYASSIDILELIQAKTGCCMDISGVSIILLILINYNNYSIRVCLIIA